MGTSNFSSKKPLPKKKNVIQKKYFSTYPFTLVKSPERGGFKSRFRAFLFWKKKMAPEEG